MVCATPKLKLHLAKQALIHFFGNSYWTKDEVKFIHAFCSEHSSDKILKFQTRLITEENNDMLVAAVLADLLPEELEFLYDKYRLEKSYTQISMKLHIHHNGLQRWQEKILTEIASLLEYNLPVDAIFSRNKVEALVFVLERTVTFYETTNKANIDILNSLKYKLDVYQNLLFAIKFFLLTDSKQLAFRTIKMKILNQRVPLSELEYLTDSSHSSIRHYLNLFQQHFYSRN